MRIAQVAPLTEAVPPKLYGGTERVVHWLTEELVALGHDVTLFASGDSQTSAKLDATWPKALRLDGAVRDPNALHMVMLERVRQKCDDEEFDFLHFHLDYYPFSLFSRQPTPFLTTLHGRLDLPEHQPIAEAGESQADALDRRPVGIEPEDAAVGAGGLQDPLGVPTAADRGIDLEAAGLRGERPEDLVRHDRQVPYLHHSSTCRLRIPSGPWKRMWCDVRSSGR